METPHRIARRVVVFGRVQGVGFRWFVCDEAERLGVHGTVQNRQDGSVLAHLEGESELVEQIIERLKSGPSGSRVERVVVEPDTVTNAVNFRIVHY